MRQKWEIYMKFDVFKFKEIRGRFESFIEWETLHFCGSHLRGREKICIFSWYKETKNPFKLNIFGTKDFLGSLLNPKFNICPRSFVMHHTYNQITNQVPTNTSLNIISTYKMFNIYKTKHIYFKFNFIKKKDSKI